MKQKKKPYKMRKPFKLKKGGPKFMPRGHTKGRSTTSSLMPVQSRTALDITKDILKSIGFKVGKK